MAQNDKKNETREFSRAFLLEALHGGQEGVEVVKRKVVDTSRWSIHHEFVFKYEEKFYETYYSVGATEMQDESPWEHDDDPVTVYVVQPVEVTVIEYR